MKEKHFLTFKMAYVLALSFLALLSLTGYFILYQAIQTQETNAKVINLSGRQRALSQQIALLSLQFTTENNLNTRAELKKDLELATNLMEESHYSLINGSFANNSSRKLTPSLNKIYFEDPLNLNSEMLLYIQNIRSLLKSSNSELSIDNAYLRHLLQNRKTLLESLDKAVFQYQIESEAMIARLRNLERSVLIITLFTLLLEAFLIFRPLAKSLQLERDRLAIVNKELIDRSTTDELTGLANRRFFTEYHERIWQRSLVSQAPLSIIICDVDNFKSYNDTYGHLQGDVCLKKIAQALKSLVKRPDDFIVRYGGEEFVVVLPNTDTIGAQTVAEILRKGVEDLNIPHQFSNAANHITISLGVATIIPVAGTDSLTLFKAADQALYKAKQNGRNQFVTAYQKQEVSIGICL